jgi:hypothetical protein
MLEDRRALRPNSFLPAALQPGSRQAARSLHVRVGLLQQAAAACRPAGPAGPPRRPPAPSDALSASWQPGPSLRPMTWQLAGWLAIVLCSRLLSSVKRPGGGQGEEGAAADLSGRRACQSERAALRSTVIVAAQRLGSGARTTGRVGGVSAVGVLAEPAQLSPTGGACDRSSEPCAVILHSAAQTDWLHGGGGQAQPAGVGCASAHQPAAFGHYAAAALARLGVGPQVGWLWQGRQGGPMVGRG